MGGRKRADEVVSESIKRYLVFPLDRGKRKRRLSDVMRKYRKASGGRGHQRKSVIGRDEKKQTGI